MLIGVNSTRHHLEEPDHDKSRESLYTRVMNARSNAHAKDEGIFGQFQIDQTQP